MATDVQKLVTPVFRLSFPAVFDPDSYDGGPPKFGFAAVWTPSKFSAADKKRWKALYAALDAESKRAFKKAFKDLPANFKKGIRDGEEKADLEGYGEGTKFANIASKMRPGVVDKDRNPISSEGGNTDEIYPGCYCRATINIYSYDNKGKGVAIGLQNLQKVADGPRLDSRTDAAEDFDDDDVEDDWLDQEFDDDIPF